MEARRQGSGGSGCKRRFRLDFDVSLFFSFSSLPFSLLFLVFAMAAASSGERGEEEREELSLRLAELATASGRRLLERIGDFDGEIPLLPRSTTQWLDAAAAARSAGPRAAARFMASGGCDAWKSKDARVVRAVAGLAVVAATNDSSSSDDADDASETAALAALAALPRALSALRASQDLAGGCLPQLVDAVRACSSAILDAISKSPRAPLVEPREASLLAAAASAAAAPPPEALFASVGGDPLLAGESSPGGEGGGGEEAASATARREWRERERACVAAAGAAVADS